MDTIQWARVMRRGMEDVEALLEENEDGMLKAFKEGQGSIAVALAVKITSKGTQAADVDTTISYVVERVKSKSQHSVFFNQEPLPGMLDEQDAADAPVVNFGGGGFNPNE